MMDTSRRSKNVMFILFMLFTMVHVSSAADGVLSATVKGRIVNRTITEMDAWRCVIEVHSFCTANDIFRATDQIVKFEMPTDLECLEAIKDQVFKEKPIVQTKVGSLF